MKKILIVSNMYPSKKFASYGIFVKRFCDELDSINAKYDLSVMKKNSLGLFKIFNYVFFYLKTFFKIIFKNYKVVYIHYASHSCPPVLLARKIKKFQIYTNVHGSDVIPENKAKEKFQKYTYKILKISDKVIVPSMYFKNIVHKKYNIETNKIYVYPSCGVDKRKFREIEQESMELLKEKYNLKNKKIFLFAGRITTDKGWDVLLRAIAKIKDPGNVSYIIAGNGDEEKKFESLMESLNIKEKIYRLPLLPEDELINFYNIADAFIFPTKRQESLGLVGLEALFCGTPVIVSDYGAPKDYITDGFNGYKFKMNDEEELKSIIEKFINNDYSKSKMKNNCLESVKEYEKENVRNLLKEILEMN